MTTDPTIVPPMPLPDLETVGPDDPPLTEEELPSEEDIEESEAEDEEEGPE